MECLNTNFTVVYYNGGAMKGLTGIQKLFGDISGKPATPHSTRSGQLFDVVLEYNNPAAASEEENVFTLEYLIATCLGSEVATAPLKTGIFFVSDSMDISYSGAFDKITMENYKESNVTPAPAGFLVSERENDLVAHALSGKNSGKYLHIKMTSSWGDDNNIDLGVFKILGQHGKSKNTLQVTDYSAVTEEEVTMLCASRFAKYTPKVGTVSMLHKDFSDTVHTDHTLLFVSTLNIAESMLAVQAGTATATQKDMVSQLHQQKLASNDVHHMMLRFYAIDPTTDKQLGNMLLSFLGETEPVEVAPTVSTCETGPYDLPLGMPMKVVQDDEDTEDNSMTDNAAIVMDTLGAFTLKSNKPFFLAAISNSNMSMKYIYEEQDMSAVLAKADKLITTQKEYVTSGSDPVGVFVRCFNLVANEHSKLSVEQSFGEQDMEGEELEVLQSMKKMGLYDKKKHGAIVSGSTTAFDENELLGLLSPRCLNSATATEVHPVYKNVVILTHDNFNKVVVDHVKPIIFSVVDLSMQSSVIMTQKLMEFSEVVQKYKLDVRVGIFDSAQNDFPLQHYDEEMYECIFLYTKTAKLSKAKGKGKPVAPTAFCVDSAKKSVYRYQLLFSEIINDEDKEMMDELANELGEEQTLPTPSIADVLAFLAAHNPKIITPKAGTVEVKKMNTLCKNMNELVDMWSYCETVTSTILPSFGERMKIKHSRKCMHLEKTSVAAGYVAQLKNMAKEVYELSQEIVLPYGKCKILLNGEDKRENKDTPCIALNSVEVKVRSIHASLEKCVEGITPVLQSVILCKTAVEGISLLMNKYPALWVEAIKEYSTQFKGFGAGFSRVVENIGYQAKVGVLPAAIVDTLANINEVVNIKAEKDIIVFYPSEMSQLGELLESCRENIEQYILQHVSKDDEGIFGQDIVLLQNDEHLERYLQGYELLEAPKKASLLGKKKVADASDRLVCVLVMSLKDDTLEHRASIAQCMREISARYKAEKLEDDTMKNVVFARVRVEEYPEIQETLNLTTFPALIFTQNMGEADDLRSSGAPAVELNKLLVDSIESMQLLDNVEDAEYMDDDEYDE